MKNDKKQQDGSVPAFAAAVVARAAAKKTAAAKRAGLTAKKTAAVKQPGLPAAKAERVKSERAGQAAARQTAAASAEGRGAKRAAAAEAASRAAFPGLFTEPPAVSRAFLDNFNVLVSSIRPLNSRQQRDLPLHIRELSHQLTDERPGRRLGYMNSAELLSAYAYYFLPWNLFRLTRLFSSLDASCFAHLQDGSVLLDIGSGPLTVPVALWLSRPELRSRRLVFYCTDLSQAALSLGEEVFLAACARTAASEQPQESWRIVRVKGGFGTEIRQKADFVFCVNLCNELFWNAAAPLEEETRKIAGTFAAYAAEKARFFVMEPGIPRASRFVSLLRDCFIQKGLRIESPCPHQGRCPMDGRRGGKWCHFVCDTESAPQDLRALSEAAGLPKDRASLAFVLAASGGLCSAAGAPADSKTANDKAAADFIDLRIISDPIKLPAGRGRYACSSAGLTLACGKAAFLPSGTLVRAPVPKNSGTLPRDKKSGALIVTV